MSNNQVCKTHMEQYTESEELKEVFYRCDIDFKGYLNREDIKVAFVELLGYKPAKSEVDELIRRYGSEGDSEKVKYGLTLKEFEVAMTTKMIARDEDEEIRETFLAFDTHCYGFLTKEDVKKVFSQVAPSLPAAMVESSFRELDQDGDGRVSFRDFQTMMKYDFDSHI